MLMPTKFSLHHRQSHAMIVNVRDDEILVGLVAIRGLINCWVKQRPRDSTVAALKQVKFSFFGSSRAQVNENTNRCHHHVYSRPLRVDRLPKAQ
jgi:hypothetical protein